MNKNVCYVLAAILVLLTATSTRAQLAGGTYTINSAAPTGGTNYASFGAAITAMAPGITGNVVFNVVAGSGPYNEQVTIGNITGASATNRIRFNGNGAMVQYSPTATYTGVLMMNGAKYVKFDSLTFKSLSSTYGFGAILYNACNYDSITRCTFDLTTVTSTSSANCMGIRISTTASGTSSTASGATNTYLGGNSILGSTGAGGPYYGFYFYGPNTNNIYENNLLSNYYYYGFYDYYGANISYLYNTMTRETKTNTTAGYYGLYLYYTTAGSRIVGNRTRNLGGPTSNSSYCYPFNLFNASGTAANPVLVSNNLVSSMSSSPYYGMRISGCDFINLYHNTISIDHAVFYTNANYGIYLTSCGDVNVKNNIVSITGGSTSTKYGLYYTGSTNTGSDYNDVYVNSTQAGTQGYGYTGTAYSTLAAFQAANAPMEANSLSTNPQFTAPATGDFTPLNTALIGAGTNLFSQVPTDITGGPRSTNPTIGAFEVLPTIANNASIATSLASPFGNFCAGAQTFKVTVSNAGTNNITSLKVNWKVNGVLQPQYSYTGTLVPITASSGGSSATVTLGTATLTSGTNTIVAWTSLPNNTTDGNTGNDSLTTTLTPATFTVTSTVDTVCTSGSFLLALSPSSGYANGALEWQSSPNGTTWTSIPGTDSVYYAGSGLSATTQFRARILNSSAGCVSPSKTIVVSNPTLLTSSGATRCGVGTLTLTATAPAGTSLTWYDTVSGGTAAGTGTSFTTPVLTSSHTYYVTPTVGGTQPTGKITPVSTSGNSGFSDIGLMFDAYVPFELTSVDVYPYSTTSTSGTVTIALKNSAGTVLQSVTANVTVGNPAVLNTIPLSFSVSPGSGQRLVVTAATGMSTLIRESATSAFSYPYTLPGISSITSAYTGGASSAYYYYFYNWQITTGCEGARTPVVATIGTAPAINATSTAASICSGSSTTVSVSSANTNYTYSWSSGNTTSSFSVSPTTSTTYIVTANDPITNCVAIDSVTVSVISQTASITPSGTQTVCNGTNTTLSANTGTGLSYQWYNGGSPIAGATNSTYSAATAGVYTVQVTNTAAGCSATSPGVTVNVVPAPTAGVTPTGPVVVCTGDTVTLQGPTGTGYAYQWKKGGVNASGSATSVTYKTTTAGTYTLVVSAYGCSTTSAATIVTLANLPVAAISPSTPPTGCDSVLFSSNTPNVTYQWNYNGLPIVGGTAATYAATVSGQYSVKTTSTANGCSATSAIVNATINQTPSGTITYSSPISFCEGGAVVLNTPAYANTSYQWMRNGSPIPAATTTSYIVDSAGLYSINVQNTVTGCGRTSAPVQVQVYPTPVATIAYNNSANILSTVQSFTQYQWRMNNQPINNAVQPTYVPSQNGAYAVSVMDANGCQTISNVFFVNSVGISNTVPGAAIRIYPNPTSGLVYIQTPEKVDYVLQDMTGRTIARGNSDNAVDMTDLAEGVYFLSITEKTGRLIRVEKIMKSVH